MYSSEGKKGVYNRSPYYFILSFCYELFFICFLIIQTVSSDSSARICFNYKKVRKLNAPKIEHIFYKENLLHVSS